MTGRFDKLLHAQRPTTAQGHLHKEAFCLMWYGCRACGHRERIWNSRDGVTPFGTLCPSCNQPELQHVDWGLDTYAPNHTPAIGQRVWVSMTRERAEAIARRRIKAYGLADEVDSTRFARIVESILHDGQAPALDVHGYLETPAP